MCFSSVRPKCKTLTVLIIFSRSGSNKPNKPQNFLDYPHFLFLLPFFPYFLPFTTILLGEKQKQKQTQIHQTKIDLLKFLLEYFYHQQMHIERNNTNVFSSHGKNLMRASRKHQKLHRNYRSQIRADAERRRGAP